MKLTMCLYIGTLLHTNMLCMGVRVGLSHWGRNVGWRCSRTGCWERYLGL